MSDDQRPFAAFVVEFANGDAHRELGDKLREICLAVKETGKPGTLTWTLKVETPEAGADMVVITDKVVAKVPELRGADSYHINARGDLARHDLDQMAFPGVLGGGQYVNVETGEIAD